MFRPRGRNRTEIGKNHRSLYASGVESVNGKHSPDARQVRTLTRFAGGGYDARTMSSKPKVEVRCPTCRRPTSWGDNPQRPFCSLVCRLIDLGVWLDEGYVVPGHDMGPDDVR